MVKTADEIFLGFIISALLLLVIIELVELFLEKYGTFSCFINPILKISNPSKEGFISIKLYVAMKPL